MDRTSRCEGSGGCWRGRHVYLAFSGAGVAGSYGWTGSGGPAYWPERTGRSTWICSGSGADVCLLGILFAAVVLILLKPLIGFFKLEDAEALAAAFSYTKIACGLIVFSFLSLTLTGLYTAQGDSKTPFAANLVGLAVNMILDPVLILGPGPFPRLGVTAQPSQL